MSCKQHWDNTYEQKWQ